MSNGSDDTVVSLEDVEVHFNSNQGIIERFLDRQIVQAVDGVSLEITEDEVVALVGESGCGKTTLGKAAIGLQRPTAGNIYYRGQDIWEAKTGAGSIPYSTIRQSLQIIHQDPGGSLESHRTVMAILTDPLKKWRPDLDPGERRKNVLSMFKAVGLTPPESYAFRYPHQLSGGEKQRVALVRSMLLQPDLVLADEAISALDVSLRVEMMDLMLDLQKMFGTSYLFISHDISNARYLTEKRGGRIGIMYLGELVEIGPPEQIIHNPQHPYTRALVWSTPNIGNYDDPIRDPPLRKIDIPDPVDPPTGCRYHTRCPEARESCVKNEPQMDEADSAEHQFACHWASDRDDYWKSDPLEGAETAFSKK